MPRPKHLPCVNTPEGIRRINEDQAVYDKDPEGWERREQAREEREREDSAWHDQWERDNFGDS